VARHAHADLRRGHETTLRDQIEEAIDEAEDARPGRGDLSPLERQMLRNLLHFGDRTAGEIASPAATSSRCRRRSASTTWSRAFADAGHSRLPVYRRQPR
jgi:magnesium and cobalt transporter